MVASKPEVSRHRKLMPLGPSAPTVAKDAWVASSATLVGEVDISNKASVWYGAVVRGEAIGWGLLMSLTLCSCVFNQQYFVCVWR